MQEEEFEEETAKEINLNENKSEESIKLETAKNIKKYNEKPYNLEPNGEAVLAYTIPPITGIVVWILEKNDDFVKFHAMQSIILGITIIAMSLVLDFFDNYIRFLIDFSSILGAIFFVSWLICIWNAYNNNKFKLPVLGTAAENQIRNIDRPQK